MEKVTVYESVRPVRGERLPRVDYTESSRCSSSPPEDLASDRAIPAHHQTRRRSTRLLPNLRYLPPYDEHRPPYHEHRPPYDEPRPPYDEHRPPFDEHRPPYDEHRPPYDEHCPPYDEHRPPYNEHRPPYDEHRPPHGKPADTYCSPHQHNRQESVYDDLNAQQDRLQSRRSSISRRGRCEALSANIEREGSHAQATAAAPRASTSTALSKKVAASKALSHSPITRSMVMKSRPQKLQQPSLTTRKRPKHKKTLAGGRQIKTHLRCEHLPVGPVWGGALSAPQQEQRQEDSLTKREAFERRRIARKIDALCAASAGATGGEGGSGGRDLVRGKRGREEEMGGEEGSPPAAKHNKLMASGKQYKTTLRCQHPPHGRRLQAGPGPASRSHQGQLASSDEETSDDDREDPLERSTGIEGMEGNRKKVVLKSNVKTPRRHVQNVYEEPCSNLMVPQAGKQSDKRVSHEAVDTGSCSVPQGESPYNRCECSRRRSSRYSSADCPYCREDTLSVVGAQRKACADMRSSHETLADVSSAPYYDYHRNAVDEPCPVCRRDGGRRAVTKGYHLNACHFCGVVFRRSDPSVVLDDEDLQRLSCDRLYGSTRHGSRHYGEQSQRSVGRGLGNHLGGTTADRERTARGATLRTGRRQTGLRFEENSRRDDEDRCRPPAGGGRPSEAAPVRDRAEGRLPPLRRPHLLHRRASGGGESSNAHSDNDNTNNRRGFERDDEFRGYKRACPTKSSSTDVGDGHSSVGLSRNRSSVGAGILKNCKSTAKVSYSDNVLQNIDLNPHFSMASRGQSRDGGRQSSDVGAGMDNRAYYGRSHSPKRSHNIRSMARKENLRPPLPRGAEQVRVKRHPTQSLVLEDHL